MLTSYPKKTVNSIFLSFENFLQNGEAITRALKALENFNIGNKLTAQYYNGAVAMGSKIHRVQTLIREINKLAMFIPCYDHSPIRYLTICFQKALV